MSDCNCDYCRRLRFPAWNIGWWTREEPGPWLTSAVLLAWLTAVGVFLFGR